MLKARIRNLETYLKDIQENTQEFCKSFHNAFHGMWNVEEVKRLNKAHDVLFSYWPGSNYAVCEKAVEKITYIDQYIQIIIFTGKCRYIRMDMQHYTMEPLNSLFQKIIWNIKKKKIIPVLPCRL